MFETLKLNSEKSEHKDNQKMVRLTFGVNLTHFTRDFFVKSFFSTCS